ncbi:MAG TPA: acyl-CoA dehydrogenase family protein [candidate division Zixibacteria bacterium]|nr:acyl-CoA dehydrogenase family protein [candidate division Zixibacteria bacterium]
MFDFTWTEEHKAVFKLVQDFGKKEVLPFIRERDRKEQFDPTILEKLGEADILGICIPSKYGGAGLDYISLGIACQELEYADTSLRVILSVHIGLTSLAYLTWGSEAQKQKYLVPQAKGEKIGSFGLTEPNAGSDVVGIQATADKKDGYYVLNGEKMWISLADVADNFLCVAWTDRKKRDKRDHTGLSAFIVERKFKGVKTGTIHGKLGVRAGNTGYVSLSDVEVPLENMLGQEGEGFKIAMFCLDQGRYTVAAGATGLTKACLDASVNYSKTRKTFNTFIGEHQLVKEMIAFMVSGFEASQLLWIRAGWLKNQGLSNSKETALAKWFACDAAEKAASDAVQVFGSYGFSDEYPVERFYRNSKGSSIYEGTREIQKLLQADYALGYKVDKGTRIPLPKYQPGS